MENNQSQINIPIFGMDRDSHPLRVKENSYTFAKNISVEDSSGNGNPVVQNEPSNILCQDFTSSDFDKIGGISEYKIIGFRYNPSLARTYLFFVNTKEDSEFFDTSVIGYIKNNIVSFDSTDEIIDCNCMSFSVLDEPLEGTTQSSTCEFKILAEDSCNKCLGFSINNPIYERNIRFKNEQCGRRMYWTDRNNPPRYVDLDVLESTDPNVNYYLHTGNIVCGEGVNYESTCFDCEKVKMIPDFDIPCLTPTDISLGGNLPLGTYEFLIAYCDDSGNELSNYYSHTNPVNLFDYNNVVMDQTEQARATNYAIKLEVSNLDQDFKFYKVAVIQKTGVNGEESYFVEGIHPITDETIIYSTSNNKQRTTLNKILVKNPKLKSVEQMVDSNGYLFLAGLKVKPVMNLQPIANLMGAYVKWATVVTKEDFYKNGIPSATYRGYMRDEVYPLSFSLGMSDGTETNYWNLIGRAPTEYDLDTIVRTDNNGNISPKSNGDLNVRSIINNLSSCDDNLRKYRWQVENTASVEGTSSFMPRCISKEDKENYINNIYGSAGVNSDNIFKKSDTKSCSILDMTNSQGENVNILYNFSIRIGGDYRSNITYLDYVSNNLSRYLDPNDVLYNSSVSSLLDKSRYEGFDCSTSNSCNCIDSSFIKEEVFLRTLDLSDAPTNEVYNNSIESIPISYIESQFPEGIRDEDYRLTSRFVLSDYGSIHSRPTRSYGNSCLGAKNIESYADIVPESTDGFVLPVMGNRDSSGYSGVCLSAYKSQGTERRNHAISARYVDGGAVYRPKGTHTRYASEVWNILRGEYFFPSFITKTALWLKTKDISVNNIIQITPSSVKVNLYSHNTNELSNSDFLSAENDIAYNKLQLIRVSIFDSCSINEEVKVPIKVLFLDSEKTHLLDLKEEMDVSSGEYYIAVDAPVVNLLHYKLSFTRQFNKVSDSYPDGQPTPEKLRYVYKRVDNSSALGYPSEFYYFPDINRDGAPQIGQVEDYSNIRAKSLSYDEKSNYNGPSIPTNPPEDEDDTDSDPSTSTTVTTETLEDGTIIKTTVFTDTDGVKTITIETTYPTGEVTTEVVENGGDSISSGQYYMEDNDSYITTSTDWAFLIVHRGFELNYSEFLVDSISTYKVQTYKTDCYYEEPNICEGSFFEEGKFAYVESIEEYPDNDELYNSSKLGITEGIIDSVLTNYGGDFNIFENESFKDIFVSNFGNKKSDGSVLEFFSDNKTNFTCTPIRHFKFPDNSISPFIYTNENMENQKSLIFPIGISIDAKVINIFLDLAVETKLISKEQRGSIVSFNLKRGDRTIEKTVLSKGLLTDVIKYKDIDGNRYFPNFPFNDLGSNSLINTINGTTLNHPYNGKYNNKFVFNSPEVDYGVGLSPTELKVDGYQYGVSESQLNIIREYPKMVILSQEAIDVADSMAKAESTFETLSQVGELGIGAAQASSGGGFLGISGVVAGAVAAGFVAAVAALRVPMISNRTAELRNKWIETFKNKGIGANFAHYITSVGDYNNFSTSINSNSKLRSIKKFVKMKDGNYNVAEPLEGGSMKINNIDREDSLFIYLGNKPNLDGLVYTPEFSSYDNSSSDIPENRIRIPFNKKIANFYASIKVWKPDQYGKLENIKWVDINKCVYLSEEYETPIIFFGGDTFISKYSYKRKFNYFLVNNIDQADFTPFKYSNYFNVGKPKYYIDYETEVEAYGKSIITTPSTKYKLFNVEEKRNYITGGMFFHFNYGIPYFFVESTINCWNRYAGTEPWQNFYPNIADYVEWTQESITSIRKPNTLNYNYIYSLSGTPKSGDFLPNNFSEKFYNCTNNSPNGIMYSAPDASEKQKVDPWLVYKNFDFYNFPTQNGKLIDLLNIESNQILGIFENQVSLFNAIDTLKERVSPETSELGTGGIFAQRPLDFNRTELGFGGTQHKASISCEFGHFWVDARRGQVFQVEPNGKNLTEITTGLRNWFKQHLPFKVLKGGIKGLTDLDLDNPFKNIGITLGWDSRYKRIFLTKLDYVVKPDKVGVLEFVNKDGVEEVDVDLDFLSTNKILRDTSKEDSPEVQFGDTEYFIPAHFTLAYSPLFKSWISYYSFTPGIYIGLDNYFMTGGNFNEGPSLWSHLLTNKSFGVFYTKKYPWSIEIITKNQFTQKLLTNVEFMMDSFRYHNEYDYAQTNKISLDTAVIYNNTNSSGVLNLVVAEQNNRYQKTKYPKINVDSSDVLVSLYEGRWSFNDFYNRATNVDNNIPLFNYDVNAIDKVFNNKAIKINRSWSDRLRGDWFFIRLTGGSDTRYKQIFKWINPKDNIII